MTETPSCPKCETPEHAEEMGESGDYWWHCHACDHDFEEDEIYPPK